MKKISIILIEDNRLLREGINVMLQKETDIYVIAAFGGDDFTIISISELKPHLVLLDLGLANQNSFELVASLNDKCPDVKIVVMDLVPIQEDILRFVEAGVSGFILKDATLAELLKTIRSVAGGEKILPPMLTGSLFSQIMDFGINEMGHDKLIQSVRMTNREKEIVELIAEGLANKEIAYKLNLSIYTVKSHVHNILEKMALHTRVQIAIHAHTNNLPPLDLTKS
jgi:DNA-binding NarL/FixJ family response regulator